VNRDRTVPPRLTDLKAGRGACAGEKEQVNSKLCEIKLDQDSISAFIEFFKLLDKWDRETQLQ